MKPIVSLSVLIFVGIFYTFTLWLNYEIWVSVYGYNNQRLDKYITEFRNISHPPNTSLVASHHSVRGSPENGRNCYYFMAQIRQFSGKRNQIKKFYLDRGIEIEFIEGDRFGKDNKIFDSPVPYGYHKLSPWKLSEKYLTTNLYLIFSLQVDFDKFDSMDLRCY